MSEDRRSVKTYVPAEQKDRWREHADELGMSQSEFVRTMVQAGRRGFSPPEESAGDATAAPEREPAKQSAGEHETDEMEPRSGGATPGVEGGETGSSETGPSDDGGDLTDRVLEVLDRDGALSW